MDLALATPLPPSPSPPPASVETKFDRRTHDGSTAISLPRLATIPMHGAELSDDDAGHDAGRDAIELCDMNITPDVRQAEAPLSQNSLHTASSYSSIRLPSAPPDINAAMVVEEVIISPPAVASEGKWPHANGVCTTDPAS